ncbi:hypothetical protein [Anaerovorax sp. IOR16]|uniref:hypothetical protein n=1 Tax=Anaerovorax sp. IOR16 TaxID=2773458 RepID=UPI0019D27653|nr:hypothetical protein [Anaerovorax sp. IOR16]
MKQVIVMVAMIVLGIALAMMVLSFKQPAKAITDTAKTSITKILNEDAVNGD